MRKRESRITKGIKAKGERGYISFMKKRTLIRTLIMFGVAAAVFVAGLALNKWEKGNVFTIIACVLVIPAARVMTSFILFFPFKTVSEESYDETEKAARAGSIIYADNVIASPDKALSLDYLVITGSKIIGQVGRDNEKLYKIQDYMSDTVRRRGFDYKVTVTDDRNKFLSLLKNSDSAAAIEFESEAEKAAFDAERAELCKMLESIMI